MTDERIRLSAGRPGIGDELAASVLGTLSPTARRILKASYRVLERDGYEGLSLRRIAQEAGETRSLILYHFESKAGLVATLVDSLWHDADIALMEEVEGLAADPRGRVLALTGLHRHLALQPELYRTYFDLLPHVLRDHDARSRLMRTYRSYRRIGELCLAPAVPDATPRGPLATHAPGDRRGDAGALAAGGGRRRGEDRLRRPRAPAAALPRAPARRVAAAGRDPGGAAP